jgi:hypothetical protein
MRAKALIFSMQNFCMESEVYIDQKMHFFQSFFGSSMVESLLATLGFAGSNPSLANFFSFIFLFLAASNQ